MLWGLAAFFLVIGLVYGATSQEAAGTILLLLCSAASVVAVLPLYRQRRAGGPLPAHSPEPGASLWPFVIGAGAVLAVDGLVLGPWLFVPGAALIVRGLVGILGRLSPSPTGTDQPEEGPPTV
jgi:hypothetical protein